MGRYELDEDLVKRINDWNPRWYNKYDNADVLNLTYKESREYWSDIEELERFSKYYPDSNIPTFEDEGVTEQALQTYIMNKCDIFADAKMREIDLSMEKWEDVLDDCLKRYADEEQKGKALLVFFSIVGALLWLLIVLVAGRPLFELSIVAIVFIMVIGWFSATIGIILLFITIDEMGNPVINHLIQKKHNKILYQMPFIDSCWPRVNKIRQLQKQYLNEKWEKERKQKQNPSNNLVLDSVVVEQPETGEATDEVISLWPLLEFGKLKGKMQVATYLDNNTNKEFKTCLFTDATGRRLTVYFDQELGELSSSEIVGQKDHLIVVLLRNGNYYLRRFGHKKGPANC